VPLIVCEEGVNEQVMYATGLVQAKLIAPEKPVAGAAVTVTVPAPPAQSKLH
jgi:hypothetical protein